MSQADLFEGVPADRTGEDVRHLLLDPGPCHIEDGHGFRCLLIHGHDSDHFGEAGWFGTPRWEDRA